MNKAIKVIIIIILVQITLVLAGWMYQKATDNKISNHLNDLSEWYYEYIYKKEYEKYKKEYEKWWLSLNPQQQNNYHREMDEIDEKYEKKRQEECEKKKGLLKEICRELGSAELRIEKVRKKRDVSRKYKEPRGPTRKERDE